MQILRPYPRLIKSESFDVGLRMCVLSSVPDFCMLKSDNTVLKCFSWSLLASKAYLEWNNQGQHLGPLSMDQCWAGMAFQLADHVNGKPCDCTQASRVVKQISRRMPGSHLPQLPHIFQPQALDSRSSGGGAGSLAWGSLAIWGEGVAHLKCPHENNSLSAKLWLRACSPDHKAEPQPRLLVILSTSFHTSPLFFSLASV